MVPIRAYVVEDHEDMRFLLLSLLERNFSNIEIVGESETAENALKEICRLHPTLILVDISLPGISGIEMIRRLRPLCRAVLILVVTGHEVDLYRAEALAAGADDIVSKRDLSSLIEKIRSLISKAELGF